jgi:CO/xanthine dehydrogenase FAD-binding subunit
MKLLVLQGQGVKLNAKYIADTSKVEVQQNNTNVEDGVAIYDCSHKPIVDWADQIVAIGTCTEHNAIVPNTIIDESTDAEMQLILLIRDLYNEEADIGTDQHES